MKTKQGGFTLIEIAIVLVIIGLLLGGILKGQELINSAKVKNLANDFRTIPLFIYGYQDKFRALPGDDAQSLQHVGVSPASTPGVIGNGVIEGAWYSTTATDESYLFWQQVRVAGFASGSTAVGGGDYQPRNAENGVIGIQSGTSTAANSPIKDKDGNAIRGSYVICSSAILGKYVLQLDQQLDNGEPDSGTMLAAETPGTMALGLTSIAKASAPASGSTPAVVGIDPAKSYVVCIGV